MDNEILRAIARERGLQTPPGSRPRRALRCASPSPASAGSPAPPVRRSTTGRWSSPVLAGGVGDGARRRGARGRDPRRHRRAPLRRRGPPQGASPALPRARDPGRKNRVLRLRRASGLPLRSAPPSATGPASTTARSSRPHRTCAGAPTPRWPGRKATAGGGSSPSPTTTATRPGRMSPESATASLPSSPFTTPSSTASEVSRRTPPGGSSSATTGEANIAPSTSRDRFPGSASSTTPPSSASPRATASPSASCGRSRSSAWGPGSSRTSTTSDKVSPRSSTPTTTCGSSSGSDTTRGVPRGNGRAGGLIVMETVQLNRVRASRRPVRQGPALPSVRPFDALAIPPDPSPGGESHLPKQAVRTWSSRERAVSRTSQARELPSVWPATCA